MDCALPLKPPLQTPTECTFEQCSKQQGTSIGNKHHAQGIHF